MSSDSMGAVLADRSRFASAATLAPLADQYRASHATGLKWMVAGIIRGALRAQGRK